MSDSIPALIAVPRPHVPFGPKGVPEATADADYLREAADHIEGGFPVGGSNLTATVLKLLRDAADALESLSAPSGDDREALLKSLEVAMLGTTDGGFIEPESEIPAGEMFRLAGEWVEDNLSRFSLPEPAKDEPHVVSTVEELEALPLESVIRTPQQYTLEHLSEGWYRGGVMHAYQPRATWVPATVLWLPVEEGTK